MDFKNRSKRIKDLIKGHKVVNFVETGTYLCYMVADMLPAVQRIWTVELNKEFYENAVKKYGSDPRVKLLFGDSGVMLGGMLADTQDCLHTLVFLDAHFSGGKTSRGIDDSPLARELIHVFEHRPKVVVVDDRHTFGQTDWPSEESLKKSFNENGYDCSVYDNILIAVLNESFVKAT